MVRRGRGVEVMWQQDRVCDQKTAQEKGVLNLENDYNLTARKGILYRG